MKHFSYPDIGQFRQAIRNVTSVIRYAGKDAEGNAIYDGSRPLPKIKYRGTVKSHGTNSGIAMNLSTGEFQFQSRERRCTPENDNAGFATYMSNMDIPKLFRMIPTSDIRAEVSDDPNGEVSPEDHDVAVIYGEWCAGNIQKGVAITGLPKMLVIFSIKYRGVWLPDDVVKTVKMPEHMIFNMLDYPSHDIEIDFQNPELSQAALVEECIKVENECPLGKAFGQIGVGEGRVYKPIDPAFNSSRFWFKVKGEKHSVSKVKTLAAVDVEKVKTINEFIEKTVTENRLKQGVETLQRNGVGEIEHKHIGDFIRWVHNDVLKEEKDTLLASGLEEKELGGPVAKKAKEWLFKNYLK